MKLRCIHNTTYDYSDQVSLCHTETRLMPRNARAQSLIEYDLSVDPEPRTLAKQRDFFGNVVTIFSVDRPHRSLRISSTSRVELGSSELIHPALTPSWEAVRDAVEGHETEPTFEAFQFAVQSPRISPKSIFHDYALPSFASGRPILECALDLSSRIYGDFRYDRTVTTVNTSVDEVLRSRNGVCQDFAHVMIACLRSLRLPARYVSGYLHTDDTTGSHASHAWVSIYCMGFDWIDLDPTNNVQPTDRHVTLAWGRDYSDVPPVKGVALGGGDQSTTISVVVTAEESDLR
jgi:transglutaminase-like putative cysteine protease